MSSIENAFLKAVHATLNDDAELNGLIGVDAIFDRLLSRPKLPAIVFGECETKDYSTATETGYEHLLTIEVWSEAHGRRALQAIEARTRALLHDADLPLLGAVLVSLLFRKTRVRRVARNDYFVAEMQFRAVTEPV